MIFFKIVEINAGSAKKMIPQGIKISLPFETWFEEKKISSLQML